MLALQENLESFPLKLQDDLEKAVTLEEKLALKECARQTVLIYPII